MCVSFCVSTKLKTTFEHCFVHFYMLKTLYSPPEVLLDSRACFYQHATFVNIKLLHSLHHDDRFSLFPPTEKLGIHLIIVQYDIVRHENNQLTKTQLINPLTAIIIN